MRSFRIVVAVVFCLLAVLPTASGQSVTGQISGTVVDPSGGALVGATVQLTHDLSQQTRSFITDASGSFVFTNLVPGAYSLRIAVPGFKAYDQKGVSVAALERVDLHEIKLSIGEVTTTVEVQADIVHVATSSSDRSVTLDSRQIADTPTRGRNPLALIMALPGVQAVGGYDFRGWSGGGIPAINGGQTGQVILNLDGAASQDSGNPNPGYIAPSVDAIGEAKLLVSNFPAEYSRKQRPHFTGPQFKTRGRIRALVLSAGTHGQMTGGLTPFTKSGSTSITGPTVSNARNEAIARIRLCIYRILGDAGATRAQVRKTIK